MKGFKVIQFNDIQKELTHYHKHGAKPGIDLGFNRMVGLYTMRDDGCTDFTGYPQNGKTEFVLECLFNASTFYGWKHLLYVPDIGNAIEVMAILIHKHTGKTFDKKYSNTIEIADVYSSTNWLLEHFHILEKTDHKAKMTPVEFWEFAAEYKKTHGINTATIDSWKDMDHNYNAYGGNYAMYLSSILPIRNMIAEQNKIHFITVIHPKTPRRDKDGNIAHPGTEEMEGGAQWNNSGKCILSVHRPTFDAQYTDIQVLKAKPRIAGARGIFTLNFDPTTSRYYEITDAKNGGTKKYATIVEKRAQNK
ncbi:MAG TPA: hypothetical protein VFM99_01185 [Chitinophagales bacterium]|nr:hypothetical protein [Chitinophagales bacterium]